MAPSPDRKMVQTVLNFHPERRIRSSSQSQYSTRRPHNDASAPHTPVRRSVSDQEMEDVQATSTSFSQETGSSQISSNMSSSITSQIAKQERRKNLVEIAERTTSLLPNILVTAPHAPPKGYLYAPPKPPRLLQKYCLGFPSTAIRVLNEDTFDAAIGLAQCGRYITVRDKRPVCVLNMANAYSAGGGWKRGALAQEEALCYRSSLSFTLKLRYYPLPEFGAIYSPTVLIIRENMEKGHGLLDLSQPDNLPVVSVISIAALCMPKLENIQKERDGKPFQREIYRDPQDRETMKEKMRVILRTAAFNGHRRLVLGAFGCSAFYNPREEVADCWAEVFDDQEFAGGWWESIIFAVMDDLGEGEDGDGNFGVFFRRLNGKMV